MQLQVLVMGKQFIKKLKIMIYDLSTQKGRNALEAKKPKENIYLNRLKEQYKETKKECKEYISYLKSDCGLEDESFTIKQIL